MKLISTVEYNWNSNIIRTSTQYKIEQAVMNENAIRFKLACNSSLFYKENLIKLGSYGQNKEAQTLLWED